MRGGDTGKHRVRPTPLRLRIGVNLGEVIVGPDGDLFGDGINIAVRLEGGADPGGILTAEDDAGHLRNKNGGNYPAVLNQ
jgi:class 3 adenylate cyclase